MVKRFPRYHSQVIYKIRYYLRFQVSGVRCQEETEDIKQMKEEKGQAVINLRCLFADTRNLTPFNS